VPIPHASIQVAGALHLLFASANVFAFGKFRYQEHLRNLPLIMRQVFLVQNAYIMYVLLGFAMLCFFFAGELTSGRSLGLALACFLAFFWSQRVLLQLLYFDRELRRANRLFDVLFLLAESYLAAVFTLAALLPRVTEG
jgi:hypothetical protein